MTLTRPSWAAKVTSVPGGWTATESGAAEGYTPPARAAGAYRLAGSLSLTWGWPDGGFPGQLDPETASFTVRVPDAATMPKINQGDQLVVELTRPLAGGTSRAYLTLTGKAQDPSVNTYAGGLLLGIVVTELRGQLAEVNASAPPFPLETLPERLQRIGAASGVNLSYTHPAVSQSAPIAPRDVDNVAVWELVTKTLAGAMWLSDNQLVLRTDSRAPSVVDPSGGGIGAFIPGTYPNPNTGPTFYLQVLPLHTTDAGLPYKFAVSGGQLRAAVIPNPTAVAGQRLVVPAKAIPRDGITWRKARTDSTNQVKLTGRNAAGEDVTGVASWPDLVARYGPNQRTVESEVYDESTDYTLSGSLDAAAEDLLGEYDAAVPDWSLPEFTIDPELLTDAELDNIAGKLYPPAAFDINSTCDLSVSLLGIAPAWQLGGKADLHGTLTGASFTVTGGKLRISGRLSRRVLRPARQADVATFATLRANPAVAAAKFRGTTGTVVDPAMTLLDLRLIGKP